MDDDLKRRALRDRIEAGVEALERGDFVEISDANLDSYLEGLALTTSARDH
jgi:antitoxin ParD1/3/4